MNEMFSVLCCCPLEWKKGRVEWQGCVCDMLSLDVADC